MELEQILLLLKRRWLYLTLIPIVFSVITGVITKSLIPPVYESSASLYIITQEYSTMNDITYEDLLKNQNLVNDYRELIKSKLIAKEVIQDLNLNNIAPDEVSGKISVSSKNDTRLIQITVKDKDPVMARNLANAVCRVFTLKASDFVKINNISVIDEAELPTAPSSAKTIYYVLIAFLVTFFIVFGTFYLIDLFNKTIMTSDDIENYLGLSVLGTIPAFNIK